ncbi:MAG: HTH domain-containing protein [Pseudomonadota bacterium]
MEIIYKKIKNKESFTNKSLAKELKVNEKTIERAITQLKNENKIEFIGSKKTGHWKIRK